MNNKMGVLLALAAAVLSFASGENHKEIIKKKVAEYSVQLSR